MLAGEAAIIFAIGLGDGVHQSVANAEIRKAHGRNDGDEHHPNAVALRAEIAIGERYRDQRSEQANGPGDSGGQRW